MPAAILQRRSKLGFGGSYTSWTRGLKADLLAMASDPERPVFRIVDPIGFRQWVEQDNPAAFRVATLDVWLTAFGMMPGAIT